MFIFATVTIGEHVLCRRDLTTLIYGLASVFLAVFLFPLCPELFFTCKYTLQAVASPGILVIRPICYLCLLFSEELSSRVVARRLLCTPV